MTSTSPIAGTSGPCRAIRGRPLFAYMRSVKNCRGSKIDHLLNEGAIDIKRVNFDNFMDVLRRLLRDAPMSSEDFSAAVACVAKAYGLRGAVFTRRGLPNLIFASRHFIGDVRLLEGEISSIYSPPIVAAREIEFQKKKYKKMPKWRLDFLVSLFELSELTKQISKE